VRKSLLFRTVPKGLFYRRLSSSAGRKRQSIVFVSIVSLVASKVNGKNETLWMENNEMWRQIFHNSENLPPPT
jgi:hypothetical protein